jgi:hypothetical protein
VRRLSWHNAGRIKRNKSYPHYVFFKLHN